MKIINNLLLIIIFSILSLASHSQIKTIFKGDTVVILSSDKVDEINQVFTTQKKRIEDLKGKLIYETYLNDSLDSQINIKNQIIDSLNYLLSNRNDTIFKIQERLNTAEKWILESSINSSYTYYSWQDSTIKRIDTKIYMLVGYRRSGNFSLVRVADNKDIEYYMREYWPERQSPPLNWELDYKERVRPIIYNYPFKINF